MIGLSLFSGIGGIDVALSEYVQPIAYCEIDRYCQGVLLSRMASNDIGKAPIWDDITTFQGGQFKRVVDIIFGGFPCQDISVAGHGAGLEGKRSGLFFEIIRLAKEIKPKFIFLENVPAITARGGLQVVREIAEMGYDCRWCHVSAKEVGARHKRERWFLLANTTSESANGYTFGKKETHTLPRIGGYDDSKTNSKPSEQANISSSSFGSKQKTRGNNTTECWSFESREHWQETVDSICRSSDGVSNQVDRMRALGNAVVPQCAKKAFKILMGIK